MLFARRTCRARDVNMFTIASRRRRRSRRDATTVRQLYFSRLEKRMRAAARRVLLWVLGHHWPLIRLVHFIHDVVKCNHSVGMLYWRNQYLAMLEDLDAHFYSFQRCFFNITCVCAIVRLCA